MGMNNGQTDETGSSDLNKIVDKAIGAAVDSAVDQVFGEDVPALPVKQTLSHALIVKAAKKDAVAGFDEVVKALATLLDTDWDDKTFGLYTTSASRTSSNVTFMFDLPVKGDETEKVGICVSIDRKKVIKY